MARNFYISSDAYDYMTRINKNSKSGKFPKNLHFWWLCALVGLVKNDDSKTVTEPRDMVDHFNMDGLRDHQDRIRALLLMRVIGKSHVGGEYDRSVVERIMKDLFNNAPASKLTELGSQTLDRFAESGFRTIADEIGMQTDLKNFMRFYDDLMRDLCETQ